MSEQTWRPGNFTETDRKFIGERVRDIGFRLQKSPKVLEMSQIVRQQSGYGRYMSSYPLNSLAEGPLGLVLLFNELHRVWPAEDWIFLAHKYLAEPLRSFSLKDDDALGLLYGASGLYFVMQRLSLHTSQYEDQIEQLETLFQVAAKNQVNRLLRDEYPRPENYDLVSGSVGLAASLLLSEERDQQRGNEAVLQMLYHLIWLCKQDTALYLQQFALWYGSIPLQQRQRRWQAQESTYRGNGVRYGLAGPVALLSIALQKGLDATISDIPETLELLCKQVVNAQDKQGWYWPQTSYRDQYHCPGNCAPFAWCNGASGTLRALWLAGCALHDTSLCNKVLESLAQMGKSFRKEPVLIGPSLCHGLAGMIQVYAHFAHETREPSLSDDLSVMTQRLLELFEPDRPFGYRTFRSEYIRIDSPWLFEGAAGVALALLTTISPYPPTWDRIMLLA